MKENYKDLKKMKLLFAFLVVIFIMNTHSINFNKYLNNLTGCRRKEIFYIQTGQNPNRFFKIKTKNKNIYDVETIKNIAFDD